MDGAHLELLLCEILNECSVSTFSPGPFVDCVSHRAPIASPRKRKYEEDERQTIPNVLQGEVARLNPKFLVNLDPSHCSNNGTVHLICKLGKRKGGDVQSGSSLGFTGWKLSSIKHKKPGKKSSALMEVCLPFR